jgi:DinB superfamily
MTDRSFVDANAESSRRLAKLVATLTPIQMTADLGGGWTVASALAHAGFWDRWQATRWAEMLAGDWSADDASVLEAEHLANTALDPYWAAIGPDEVGRLAVEAATALDALIAAAPDALVDAVEGSPAEYLLHRNRHRADHMDHIERVLAAAGMPVGQGAAAPDRSHLERNRASRAALIAAVDKLSPADLDAMAPGGDWTVGQLLGHMAFWDRFLAARWNATLAAGPGSQPIFLDQEAADLLNVALPTAWLALAKAGVIGAEVKAAAAEIDRIIESLPPEAPVAAVLAQRPNLLDRSKHRAEHLGELNRILGGRLG